MPGKHRPLRVVGVDAFILQRKESEQGGPVKKLQTDRQTPRSFAERARGLQITATSVPRSALCAEPASAPNSCPPASVAPRTCMLTPA